MRKVSEKNEFGIWLKAKREAKNLSRSELGAAAGIKGDTVSKIEKGIILRPPECRLIKFAEVLGESLEEIYKLLEGNK